MSRAADYIKIVEWSDADQSFVGRCPGIVGPCCHGDNEAKVYRQLCVIVEEWIEIMQRDGDPFPPRTAGRANAIAELLIPPGPPSATAKRLGQNPHLPKKAKRPTAGRKLSGI